MAAGIYGGEIFESLKNCTFMGVIIFNSDYKYCPGSY